MTDLASPLPDWEAFYRDYKQPGYVAGFEITSKLGGGMFGLVFKANKLSIGKDYAIKFLKVDDGEVRRAVLLELEQVKYFAQVDHPNLVSIEDKGEVDGIPYIVMAYAGAGTLAGRLPGKPEERDELLRYFAQACRGVAALHERSLVHFDLKPANVFLKGSVARVGDYGLSKLVTHSRGSLSMGRGTPYYMAPEMLQRRGDVRSDVYSLGVMLYEILCGELPFRGDSEWEVLHKHEQEAPSFPPQLAARERAVLARCLQKDPAQRFQSVPELMQALGAEAAVGSVAGDAPLLRPSTTAVAAARPATAAAAPDFATAPWCAPVAGRRRRSVGWSLVGMLLVIGFVSTLALSMRSARRSLQSRTVIAAETPRRAPSRDSGSLAVSLREFVREAATALVDAQRYRRTVDLHPLEADGLALPPDFDHYKERIEALAGEGQFSAGQARKLEQLGYPQVLAAVDWLQSCEFDDAEACQQAWLVLQFLKQATAVEIMIERPGDEVDAVTTARCRLAADRWRRLLLQFCRDDAAFRRLLVASGKLVVPGRG